MAGSLRLHQVILLSWVAVLIVGFLLNYVQAARVTTRWKRESRHGMGPSRKRVEQQHLRIAQGVRGAVAADEGRCSAIGKHVMENDGGNAVDAAVATALCLGVVNPGSSGIGGGGFLLLFLAETGQAIAYDLREVAPAASSELMPDIIKYESWTTIVGDHIEEPEVFVKSLQEKGHNVTAMTGAMLQLIVQNVTEQTIRMVIEQGHAKKASSFGKLIAVSDLRKDGFPAAY